MEISAEKTKSITKPVASRKRSRLNGQKLDTVTSFKYLGSLVSEEDSKPEILYMVDYPTAALIRVKPAWNDRIISFSSKVRLMRSLVTSIFLYVCKSWTLTAELQRRIRAMELRCYRKVLRYLIQRSYYQRGSLCQDSDPKKKSQTTVQIEMFQGRTAMQ